MALGEGACPSPQLVPAAGVGEQLGDGRGEAPGVVGDGEGGGPKQSKPSPPREVVTTALPAASACSTFIRMPPPVRTGATTTAAAPR